MLKLYFVCIIIILIYGIIYLNYLCLPNSQVHQGVPNVKRAASIEEQNLRMRQLAGRITAASQISFNRGVVTLDNTETSV